MTAADYFRQTVGRLAAVLGPSEGEAAARIIFEDVAGYDRKWLFMNGNREITDFMQGRIAAVAAKVEAGDPVQYAVGSALFMGLQLKVTPDVLIPRFETEGLVDGIIDRAAGRSDLSVLDIGTGSGAIAIALARALPFCRVSAMDISAKALDVARANAKAASVNVDFIHQDILKAVPPAKPCYDIIVSNPPYVTDSERPDMDPRVANHEPAMALFVPDSDPLRFYSAITRYARQALNPGGLLAFEINSRFATQVVDLVRDSGFTDVDCVRDYRGNQRFVFCS